MHRASFCKSCYSQHTLGKPQKSSSTIGQAIKKGRGVKAGPLRKKNFIWLFIVILMAIKLEDGGGELFGVRPNGLAIRRGTFLVASLTTVLYIPLSLSFSLSFSLQKIYIFLSPDLHASYPFFSLLIYLYFS